MSSTLFQDLKKAFEYLGNPVENEDVRVVILKGNGRAFSSGLDLSSDDGADSFTEQVEKHGPDVARIGLAIRNYIQM